MMAHDPEQEYQEALAAYHAAQERLRVAKLARPSQPVLRHRAFKREQLWQAYLAGNRDVTSLAQRFHLSPNYVSSVVRAERQARSFGPPTAHEYRMIALLHEVHAQFEWNRNAPPLVIS